MKYNDRHHHLIVTDVMMPRFDGIETIRYLRRAGADAKVVAMTGGGLLSPDLLLNMATKLGTDAVLAKPFEPQELVDLAATLLKET